MDIPIVIKKMQSITNIVLLSSIAYANYTLSSIDTDTDTFLEKYDTDTDTDLDTDSDNSWAPIFAWIASNMNVCSNCHVYSLCHVCTPFTCDSTYMMWEWYVTPVGDTLCFDSYGIWSLSNMSDTRRSSML